jgi:hypothetical protein
LWSLCFLCEWYSLPPAEYVVLALLCPFAEGSDGLSSLPAGDRCLDLCEPGLDVVEVWIWVLVQQLIEVLDVVLGGLLCFAGESPVELEVAE